MGIEEIIKDFLMLVKGELDPHTNAPFEIETNNNSGTLFSPSHIQFAAYGRGPGKKPPLQPIIKWIEENNIKFENQTVKGTAFAIQNSIGKNGTKNYTPNAPDILEQAINKHIQKYLSDLGEEQVSQVSTKTDEILKSVVKPFEDFKL